MAESEYGAAPWFHDRIGARNPDAELTAPLLAAHAPFQQQLPPMYRNQYTPSSHPSMSQIPALSNTPTSNHPPTCPPLPSAGNRHHYYASYAQPYQFINPQRPSPAWNGPPLVHPGHAFYDPGVMLHSEQLRYHPGASSHNQHRLAPSHPVLPPTSRRRYDSRMSVGSVVGSAATNAAHSSPEGGQIPAPEARVQHPRPPPRELIQRGEMTYPGSGQRPWMSPDGPSRRSDRSVSPRTSNRRNFERYSVDLSHSSTSSDAEEAAARAPPLNRMRDRSRGVRPAVAGRYPPYFDPNIATVRQIEQLKSGLPRHLPSALPEEASKACDICQKDYAAAQVSPTEEEEIAVELSCGHTFGEFCIGQWFDTCRTHKNKVTCPMCRKQLIEAPPFIQSMMHGQAFLDLLARQHVLAHGVHGHVPQA